MTAQIKKGFTLIELLIVIAILGVLAVVVLVAINPVQQLARTRDAGRISTISQLGRAIQSYYTSHNGSYPTVLQWTTGGATGNILVTSGEVTQIPGLPTQNPLDGPCITNAVNGWCYQVNGSTSFVIFAQLEADVNKTLGTAGCTASTVDAYAAYSSLLGRTCITCNGIPGAGFNGPCAN